MMLFQFSNTTMPESEKRTMDKSFAYVRLSRGISSKTPSFARWKNGHRQSFHNKLQKSLRRQMEEVKNEFSKQNMEDKRYRNEKRRQEKILNFVRRNPALVESI